MKQGKKKSKINRTAKIWIISLSILGGIGIIIFVVFLIVNATNSCPDGFAMVCDSIIDREYCSCQSDCPDGSHMVCSTIDGRQYCSCRDNQLPSSMPADFKPIIYLYPEETTAVHVKLGAPERISASYPEYADGWDVTAYPCGKLIDNDTGRELYGLYWEGKDVDLEIGDSGFIVRSEDVAKFLEEKLAILGLNDREAEEFIVYWLPKLQANEYNLVRFADKAEIDKYMPLEITSNPDTIIRILMLTKVIDAPIDIDEQDLGETPTRDGFTVVEWGGSEL